MFTSYVSRYVVVLRAFISWQACSLPMYLDMLLFSGLSSRGRHVHFLCIRYVVVLRAFISWQACSLSFSLSLDALLLKAFISHLVVFLQGFPYFLAFISHLGVFLQEFLYFWLSSLILLSSFMDSLVLAFISHLVVFLQGFPSFGFHLSPSLPSGIP